MRDQRHERTCATSRSNTKEATVTNIADTTMLQTSDPHVSTEDAEDHLELSDQRAQALRIARMAENKHADEIVVLEVAQLTTIATHFVLATAANPRLGSALVTELVRQIRRELGLHPRVEGQPGDPWVILDCLDVVVHVLAPEARQFYQLERLWADAPTIGFDRAHSTTHVADAAIVRAD